MIFWSQPEFSYQLSSNIGQLILWLQCCIYLGTSYNTRILLSSTTIRL